MRHKHHKVPTSRGGADEEWNFEDLSDYDHTFTHALDFVLFESAPRFDFRLPAWPLLPTDLQEAVLAETSRRMSERVVSEETKQKVSESMTGKKFPGRKPSEEHCRKISESLKNYTWTDEHKTNWRESVKGRKAPNEGVPHSEETKQKISEKLKGRTPWNKGLKKKK